MFLLKLFNKVVLNLHCISVLVQNVPLRVQKDKNGIHQFLVYSANNNLLVKNSPQTKLTP